MVVFKLIFSLYGQTIGQQHPWHGWAGTYLICLQLNIYEKLLLRF